MRSRYVVKVIQPFALILAINSIFLLWLFCGVFPINWTTWSLASLYLCLVLFLLLLLIHHILDILWPKVSHEGFEGTAVDLDHDGLSVRPTATGALVKIFTTLIIRMYLAVCA